MTLTEARAAVKAKLDAGLITEEEARRYQRRLTVIAAREDLHWREKKELFAVYK